MSWLVVLLACIGVRETGPNGMIGQVVDAGGEPVAGLLVESVEAQGRTNAEGRFEVLYKADAAYVHFTRDGVWYRRVYRDDDRGRTVRVQLPATRTPTLSCGPAACPVTLEWDLGDGLTARRVARCTAQAELGLDAVPDRQPSRASCGAGAGGGTGLTVADQGGTLVLTASP